tara:strand:+ start:154 stop:1167 length:1014 start_codon:yes stop_codon:yes gene_type:complete
MQFPIIAITMGDPAGIGPEIIAKFFRLQKEGPNQFIVFGSPDIIQKSFQKEDVKVPCHVIDSIEEIKPMPIRDGVFIHQTARVEGKLPIGCISSRCGWAAYDAIVQAINAANSGVLKAIVTAPVNKESLKKASVKYIGHTEILAQFSKSPEVFMLMVNDVLRVILCTIHVSLRESINLLNEKIVYRTIIAAKTACANLGLEQPRIAVAGLNPHAGENGLMGREECLIIKPAVEKAISEGLNVTGPLPPDTVFLKAREGHFDIVVAQYHDQGLIPFKYLGLDTGVNITMGLPFVRTSPDHGTAFEIAGKGLANPCSFIKAVSHATSMINLSSKTDAKM